MDDIKLFDCYISKIIWQDSECELPPLAYLYRVIKLPFTPFIGLSISEDRWHSGAIESISWSSVDEKFVLRVADEFTNDSEIYDYTPEWVLEYNLRFGWLKEELDSTHKPD